MVQFHAGFELAFPEEQTVIPRLEIDNEVLVRLQLPSS